MTTTIVEPFGDGEYSFRLGHKEWEELDQLEIGPLELLDKLRFHRWRFRYPRAVILAGLVGGGLDRSRALRLVKVYVEDRPIADNTALAIKIMVAGLWTPEKLGEAKAATENENTTDSTSAPLPQTLQ